MNKVDNFFDELSLHNHGFENLDICKYKLYDKPLRVKHRRYLRHFFNTTRFSFLANAFVGWGLNESTFGVFEQCRTRKAPFFLLEDGFIRSIYTWCAKVSPNLNNGISYCVDTQGFYYDSFRRTDLEDMLNHSSLNSAQLEYAKKIIKIIVENKISKYNNQPIVENLISNDTVKKFLNEKKKKILIIDQSYGDQSLIRGRVNDLVFDKMINDALEENPGAEIYFKVHPDTIAQEKSSGFLKKHLQNIIILDIYANPISILEYVDKVYVATSQMGMEALFLGKNVHVYGLPFYSGWGFTFDRQVTERRVRKLDFYEFFYNTYINYTHYINPFSNRKCDIEEAIDIILSMKNRNSIT